MDGVRPGSNNAVLLMFLILLFGLIGTVLVVLGFDLNDVDAWLEAQGGWLDAVGTVLFRVLCGVVFLMSALLFLAALYETLFARQKAERLGLWTALGALAVGYFAFFGAFY